MTEKNSFQTSIGGQALIEGLMMKGPQKSALSVRHTSGEIKTEVWDTEKTGGIFRKIPIIRGVVALVSTMMIGYRCLMKSMDLSEAFEEEAQSKFDQFIIEKFGDKLNAIIGVVGGVIAVILSVFLFLYLPALLVSFAGGFVELGGFKGLFEGLIKIVVFTLYLMIMSKIPDIQRVFMYHGAEHKTISAYEAGEDLTVENIKKYTRFHPRCGTSFLFIALAMSILVFSFISWDNLLVRVALKLLLTPLTIGISFEIIKYAGRHTNWLTKILSAPGLWLQNFTTNEPDDSQIQVAISAMAAVLPTRKEDAQW